MTEDDFRFCPRCGAGLTRVQRFDRLRPVCPACGWIFFHDPKVAVAVVVLLDGQLLLARRVNEPGRGYWSLPGGYMDAGEDPRQAASRECREETGLMVRVTRLLDLLARPADSQGAHLILYFEGEMEGGALQAGDDADMVGFFPLADLPPLAFETPQRILDMVQAAPGRANNFVGN
jgi:ADP-ribose pyrophosphatase YjhB (NUDIX family)